MNNHQNTIFHQFKNFLKTPLALLEVNTELVTNYYRCYCDYLGC
ncbi:hypothetical protein MNB_SUP05-SYMBIONT-4-842 [hydrothermal vent metagenome]|uniref:Uncharacterized protein n=1 Tax=hydrothermal vent metagenome TaxID=652676 RepID=A0A1W1DT31_9ZZZZ